MTEPTKPKEEMEDIDLLMEKEFQKAREEEKRERELIAFAEKYDPVLAKHMRESLSMRHRCTDLPDDYYGDGDPEDIYNS